MLCKDPYQFPPLVRMLIYDFLSLPPDSLKYHIKQDIHFKIIQAQKHKQAPGTYFSDVLLCKLRKYNCDK